MVDISSASRVQTSVQQTQQQRLEQQRQQQQQVQPTQVQPAEQTPEARQWQGQSTLERAGQQVGGFFSGIWGGVTDLGRGLRDMGEGALNLTGINGAEAQRQTADNIGRTASTVWNNPGAVVDAVTRPITEPWSQGRYGEAIGRGVFEVGAAVLGTKGLDKLARGTQVARGLETAAEVANGARQVERAGEVANAARTVERAGEVADAARTAERTTEVATEAAQTATRVAGLEPAAAREAFTNMRGGGGHAIRHIEESGMIPRNGSLASRVEQARQIAQPILENPTHRFPWRTGNTPSEVFLGTHNGQQVAVHVASEGPHAGKALTMYAVDERNLTAWRNAGLLP